MEVEYGEVELYFRDKTIIMALDKPGKNISWFCRNPRQESQANPKTLDKRHISESYTVPGSMLGAELSVY